MFHMLRKWGLKRWLAFHIRRIKCGSCFKCGKWQRIVICSKDPDAIPYFEAYKCMNCGYISYT